MASTSFSDYHDIFVVQKTPKKQTQWRQDRDADGLWGGVPKAEDKVHS